MAQTIKLKRSSTQGAIPTTSSLALGEVAINTYDGKMYIKKNDGSDSIVELGAGGTSGGIWKEYLYTATANQTAFTGNDDNGSTLSFTTNQIQVFFNGILLEPTTDYTTSGQTVTLVSGASAGDIVQIASFSKILGSGDTAIDTFAGDNSATAFALTVNPGTEDNTQVFIDGVYQNKSAYSVSGTTLTFSQAPSTGAEIEVATGSREVSFTDATAITLSGDVNAVGGSYSGTLTVANASFVDNSKANFGTGNDLQIYHDGSNSIIKDDGTGHVQVRSGTFTIGNATLSKTSALFSSGAGQVFYHDNSAKLSTTATGISVTGDIAAVNGAYSGTGSLKLPAGTTAQRPSAAAGLFRYNTTEGKFEGYTDSWGEIGGGAADFTVDAFTANGSTAAFTLSKSPQEVNTLVYADGVYQNKDGYSVSGNTLTFDTNPPNGTKIEVTSATVAPVQASTEFKLNQFSGNGSTTAFTLSAAPASENDTSVYINGVYQSKSNYSISGTTLTFSTAPPNGTSVEVMAANSVIVSVSTPDDNTVTTAKIANGAVTAAKLAAGAGGAYNDFAIKTGAYTAVTRDQLIVNSGSAVTITLPASPSAGNVVFIKNAGAGTVTAGRNGSNINSTADDGELTTDAAATLVYVDSTIGWKEL